MGKPFTVEITTPEQHLYKGEAEYLTVPAAKGYMGVLANHAPLVAGLVKGKISLRDPEGKTHVFESQGKGFIEVLRNNVTILMDAPLKTV